MTSHRNDLTQRLSATFRWIITLAILWILVSPDASLSAHANENDFGVDISAGIRKKIIKQLSISAETEFRTQDNTGKPERLGISAEIAYKPIKYLKLGMSYTFFDKLVAEHTTKHGYIIKDYWSPRNRFDVYATGILPIGKLEISLREKYQFTHRSAKTIPRYDEDGDRDGSKQVSVKNYHRLKSKLKIEYKLKLGLIPSISAELHNDIIDGFALQKTRLTIGTDYKLSKAHVLNAFYRFTLDNKDSINTHTLGIGYTFKF